MWSVIPSMFWELHRDWNHDRHGLLPSHKLRSALNLESFTVQPQLSSQPCKKKKSHKNLHDGWQLPARTWTQMHFEHISLNTTVSSKYRKLIYQLNVHKVLMFFIVFLFLLLLFTQGKMKVPFLAVIKVLNNPDLHLNCTRYIINLSKHFSYKPFVVRFWKGLIKGSSLCLQQFWFYFFS